MTVTQPLILFFTDFGTDGPYIGQMEAAIMDEALQSRVINLIADAPSGDPRRAGYLLAALVSNLPPGCVVVAVVDPGVGTGRAPLVVEADGRYYVGPDNGLMSRVLAADPNGSACRIDWLPDRLSCSFHGRDLFAPVAGMLSIGQSVDCTPLARDQLVGMDWPRQLAEVIYIDHFGNAMTGLSAQSVGPAATIVVGDTRLRHANIFADVVEGDSFWYANSSGLVEIATNRGRAATLLDLSIGDPVKVID